MVTLEEKFLKSYKDIVGIEWYSKNLSKLPNLNEKIRILEKVLISGRNNLNKLEIKKLIDVYFQSLMIDLATNRYDDLKLLGKNKIVRGKYTSDKFQLADWYFQLQIQAYYQDNKLPIKEIALTKIYTGQTCDFEIKLSNSKSILIECKKLNVGLGYKDRYPNTRSILPNIKNSIIPDALKQLKNVQKQSDSSYFCKCIFIDVSTFKENKKLSVPDNNRHGTKAYGLSENQINIIISDLKKNKNPDIDKIYICWNNYLFIDNLPRALICSSREVSYSESVNEIPYLGWTLEAHPVNKLKGIDEIRLSKIARSWGWIITTYNSLSDPASFIKYEIDG